MSTTLSSDRNAAVDVPASAVSAAVADEGGKQVLRVQGEWTLRDAKSVIQTLQSLPSTRGVAALDCAGLTFLDTASAMLILRWLHEQGADVAQLPLEGADDSIASIFALVRSAFRIPETHRKRPQGFVAGVGEATYLAGRSVIRLLNFLGHSVTELGTVVVRPWRIRAKELFVQLEQVGMNAIPIVGLVTFLIGVVVAYLFGSQMQKYGANIFVVDGIAISMCRELSPIIVAILVAGRSGSAFTAQLGTMKLNQEIDALQTLGLSPMQVLVVPRLIAIIACMPLLVFVGDMAGIAGGMVVADLQLGLTTHTFIERIDAMLKVKHFLVGVAKAPFFALFIGLIGCRLGFSVENNARSVGLNTTRTVVQSIVAVILLNAGFAILLVELGI